MTAASNDLALLERAPFATALTWTLSMRHLPRICRTIGVTVAVITSTLAGSVASRAQQPMPPEIAEAMYESALRPFYGLFLTMRECEQRGWSFSAANLEGMRSQITTMGAEMTKSAKDRAWTNANAAFDPSAIYAKAVCDQVRGQLMAIMPEMFTADPSEPAPF